MKQVFIILSLFLSTFSFAQIEFSPQGAEWYIGTGSYVNWSQPSFGVLHLRYEGVSFELNGYTAKELVTDTSKDTIAQDGYKVYVYHQGTFALIYDFGQSVGDTLSVPNWALWDNSVVDMIVADIDTIEINGETLFNFIYDVPSLGIDGDKWLTTNNKFGGLNVDVLHPLAYQIDYPLSYNSRCYQDTDFGFSLLDTTFVNACDSILTTGIDDLEIDLAVKIIPNPVISSLTIQIDNDQGTWNYQIVDLLGRKRDVGQVETNTIDVGLLPNGLYFIELYSKKGGMIRTQFVKN